MKQNWFTIKQLKQNIWAIGEFRHFEKVVSYLIVGKNDALLFDTGLGIKNIAKEVKKITKSAVTVINSHQHYDHVGGNKYYKKIISLDRSLIKKLLIIDPYKFRIIHTPGHSPDSICLYENRFGYLFSGDTLYPGPIYLHLKESNIYDYIKSMKKLSLLRNINHIFPGHNGFRMKSLIIKIIYQKIKKLKKNYLKKRLRINSKVSILLEPIV